jgi:hypothetical protein
MAEGRLKDAAVFLSASVPDRAEVKTALYTGPLPKRRDEDLLIENAVVALARAVFVEGGRLVFGGHPAISPLMATVAAEYFPPESGGARERPPIVVFQSRAYEHVILEDVLAMKELGQADVRWTDIKADERYDPARSGEKQCQQSLAAMREQMLSVPGLRAMVCIGGMDGVLDEYAAFTKRWSGAPVFVFASTGGASTTLAELHGNSVRVVDSAYAHAESTPPYQLLAQNIIDELAAPDTST